MGETVNLNLKVDEDTKSGWNEFIEKEHPDINTYTALIKRSVDQYIRQFRADDEEEALDEELILDRFSELEQRLQDTHNAVRVMQDNQKEFRITEDDIQFAALRSNEEFWEDVDLSKLPTSTEKEWKER